MKKKNTIAAVLSVMMVVCLLFSITACGKDYAKVTAYSEFEAEDWSKKEVVYQMMNFDPSNLNQATRGYFPSLVNLYKDGSLRIQELAMSAKFELAFTYYGYWTTETKDGVKTVTINYFCKDETALDYATLYDDGNGTGYVTVTYTDNGGKLSKDSIEQGVASLLVKDTQVTNTPAMEWIRLASYGKINYADLDAFKTAVINAPAAPSAE